MSVLQLLAVAIGLLCGAVFLLTALRALGEFMNQWAGESDGEAVPPADHPYEPNGGLLGAVPTFPATGTFPPHTAAPRRTATLPGRRKDNAHDRIDAEPSTLPN